MCVCVWICTAERCSIMLKQTAAASAYLGGSQVLRCATKLPHMLGLRGTAACQNTPWIGHG